HAVCADVVVNLVGYGAPTLGVLGVFPDLRQTRAAVQGDPAKHLGGGEVLGFAADFPDAAVGFAPVADGTFDLVLEDGPHALVECVPRAGMDVHGVEQGAPNVVLTLAVGTISHPHRTGALVPREV